METPFQITVDCVDAERMAGFWATALGYIAKPPPAGYPTWDAFAEASGIEAPEPGSISVIVDPAGTGPEIKFLRALSKPRRDLGFNFELRPGDEGRKEALVGTLTEAGAALLKRQRDTNGWWAVMADPEGNEFCVI